jgi:hypothetical protein
MKRNGRHAGSRALAQRLARPDTQDIDRLYGLEPVYEPGEDALPGVRPDEFVAILCPWCGERLETHVDLTEGALTYIEDCQVCCRPMELTVEVEDNGALRAVKVQRLD